MALKKLVLKAGAEDARKRLDQFLTERLPEALGQPLSKGKVRKLVVAGAVYLNGKRVRIASKELIPGATIGLYIDLDKLLGPPAQGGRFRDAAFEMTSERILYEDEYLIVVDKPSGLPTQPTLDEARDNLFAAVKRFLSKRDGSADPYLGLHHRLDRDTSGVVLFTKARQANSGVSEMFSKHLARKTYRALVHWPAIGKGGNLSSSWVIENYLGRAAGGGKRAKYTAVRSGGDYAKTEFGLVEIYPEGAGLEGVLPEGAMVEARPITGRTHQIRVHLSEAGMPIVGDVFYGAKPGGAPRVMLHAASLTFPHPVNKVEITIESHLPEDFLKCLQALKRKNQRTPR